MTAGNIQLKWPEHALAQGSACSAVRCSSPDLAQLSHVIFGSLLPRKLSRCDGAVHEHGYKHEKERAKWKC